MRSLGNLWQSDAEHWQSPDREPSRTDRPGRAALLASETTQTETVKATGPLLPTQLADRPGLVVTSGPKVTLRNAFHINELSARSGTVENLGVRSRCPGSFQGLWTKWRGRRSRPNSKSCHQPPFEAR